MKGVSMSDLISRAETERLLREYADEVGCKRGEYELANGILKAVSYIRHNVPTAYDVEAVVEKLDKASYKADCLGATVKYLNFDDTVHIVRAGGKE